MGGRTRLRCTAATAGNLGELGNGDSAYPKLPKHRIATPTAVKTPTDGKEPRCIALGYRIVKKLGLWIDVARCAAQIIDRAACLSLKASPCSDQGLANVGLPFSFLSFFVAPRLAGLR